MEEQKELCKKKESITIDMGKRVNHQFYRQFETAIETARAKEL